MTKSHGVVIREVYKDYSPPARASRAVDRLLNGIPKKRLAGLKTVVITNSAGLSHDQRKGKTKARGRKVPVARCGGFYHEKWRGEPAWIQLLLDNILEGVPKRMLRIPLLRDVPLTEALFHELGHHIHKTQAPQHKEPEDVADDWKKRLSRQYLRRRYWYLMPLFFVLRFVLKPVGRMMTKRAKATQALDGKA